MRRTARTGSGGRAGVLAAVAPLAASCGTGRRCPPVPAPAAARDAGRRTGKAASPGPLPALGRTARRGGPRGHGHPGVLVRLGEDAYDVGLTGARAPGDRGTGPQRRPTRSRRGGTAPAGTPAPPGTCSSSHGTGAVS